MTTCNPLRTPMATTPNTSQLSSEKHYSDPTQNRSIVGALQYATLTRPDIAYAVNWACQHMQMPTDAHWTAVKRILRYLQDTPTHGLLLDRNSPSTLQAFSDANWAGSGADRRSTGGFAIYLGKNRISWSSRKNGLWLAPLQRQNRRTQLPNWCGFSHYSANWASLMTALRFYGATTLAPPISWPTPCSMLAPSTWKWIFISFANGWPTGNSPSVSSQPRIKLLTSSPNHFRQLDSSSYETSSKSVAHRLRLEGAYWHKCIFNQIQITTEYVITK